MYFDSGKVGCVFLMVAVPMLPQTEFGRSNHREYALHFTFIKLYPYPENGIRFSSSSS